MVCFLQVIQPISRFYCIHELVLWHDERTLRHDGTNQANKWLSSNVKALWKKKVCHVRGNQEKDVYMLLKVFCLESEIDVWGQNMHMPWQWYYLYIIWLLLEPGRPSNCPVVIFQSKGQISEEEGAENLTRQDHS